jgi:hypothetical protein
MPGCVKGIDQPDQTLIYGNSSRNALDLISVATGQAFHPTIENMQARAAEVLLTACGYM